MSNKEKNEKEILDELIDETTERNACEESIETNIGKENAEDIQEKTDADLLAEANEKLAEMKDKYLRQVAEFDNYRKRTIKEKTELILNGGEKVISSFLPVLDDMERALENIEKAQDIDAIKEGVELISQKMIKTLESQGLKKIETTDADFDTDFHEAIAMIPGQEDAKKGKIIDCIQTGYMLNDKVIRHSKVAVGQ